MNPSALQSQNEHGGKNRHHALAVFADNRKNLKKLWNRLKSLGIETRELYPALSKQKYLLNVQKTDLSLSESIFNKVLWLPSSVNLKESDQKYITELINNEL